jgi:hypothetical protein
MSTRLRRALIALSLFLMLMPLALSGFLADWSRVRMGASTPRLVAGLGDYRGAR